MTVRASIAEPNLEPFQRFLETLQRATNETQRREAFVVLASTGFGDQQFATKLALSAEYQVRFESAGLIRRGAVDSFYENLIIEFEADLGRSLGHALNQLRGYVAGGWSAEGSAQRPYLAVATDGSRWEVLSPRLRNPDKPIDEDNIHLEPSESWQPTRKDDARSLRDFLNRLFFRKALLPPTAANFAQDFGLTSPAFLGAASELGRKIRELAEDSQLDVLRQAWSDSLQVAYGSVETDDDLFVRHTYLAVLARLLVWATLERRAPEPGELDEILDGRYFVGNRVANLVEDDYFHWYQIPSETDASRVWLSLGRHLAGYDLSTVREDILKPLYEELVDPETRHDLGEYYTPDWLAALIVDRLLEAWPWEAGELPAVLDPTCGSGTFLRAVIHAVLERTTEADQGKLLHGVLSRVMGIDVHPLAVTVSRATYLIAIRELLSHARRPLTIPVFLANSLQIPRVEMTASLFGDRVPLRVGGVAFNVPEDFVRNVRDFDESVEDVLSVAREFGRAGDLKDVHGSLRARIGSRLDDYESSWELLDALGGIAHRIARLIRGRRDSVHGFMLRNHYRPAMLRHTFDYVVGNPPWLTVSDIRTEAYKSLVVNLATDANIAPRSAGEQAHTELATLFLWQAATEFLKPSEQPELEDLRIGLLMPRSVFTATHHRLLREGSYRAAMDVRELWDLEGVTPLFNVPACVVFAATSTVHPSRSKPGRVFMGRLPLKDLPWDSAKQHIRWEQTMFRLGYLGRRSAWVPADAEATWSIAESDASAGNHYARQFRQGAVIYPQSLFLVRPDGPATRDVRTVRVQTDPVASKSAKVLRDVQVNHLVDSRNLYLTAATEHVFPFVLSPDLWIVLLPTISDPGNVTFRPVDADELRRSGRVDTAAWLDWAEEQWAGARKETDTSSLTRRLDHMGQLSSQARMRRHLVLYTATGARPIAAVLDWKSLPLPFVVRDQTYWASFETRNEALYVAAALNSEFVATAIRSWMTRGLFGPRHIHKRALDVPWPPYDSTDGSHVEIVQAAEKLAQEASQAVLHLPRSSAGRRRAWLREQLSPDLWAPIEAHVEGVSRARKDSPSA